MRYRSMKKGECYPLKMHGDLSSIWFPGGPYYHSNVPDCTWNINKWLSWHDVNCQIILPLSRLTFVCLERLTTTNLLDRSGLNLFLQLETDLACYAASGQKTMGKKLQFRIIWQLDQYDIDRFWLQHSGCQCVDLRLSFCDIINNFAVLATFVKKKKQFCVMV